MVSGVIIGLITGLTYGLLAVGLVLVYKASRFVNLAHGALGALSSVLLATLVLDAGLSWWLAFPIVVAVGIGLGLLVELFVIRPLRARQAGGVTMLLVTIGVSQILLALTYIPFFSPDPTKLIRELYPLPFRSNYRILDTDITSAQLMIVIFAPLAVGGLTAFLKYSMLGKSIRAAASDPECARLVGISVDRVNAVVWALAGALSAITAVLLAPSQSVFDAGALGPSLLFRALGAAALGGFVSVPAAMVGGLGLGVIEGITLVQTSKGSSAEVMVFLAVLLVLFVRGRTISASAQPLTLTTEDRSRTRIPEDLADRFLVRYHMYIASAIALAAAIALPLLPYFNRNENRFLLTILIVFAIVGISLTVLLGWAGQVSLGHFALVGMGAYMAARYGASDLSLPLVLLIAGTVGAITMTLVGLPALRLRGLTLAVTTLGFAVMAPTWLFSQEWIGADAFGAATIPALGVKGVGKLDTYLSIYYTGVVLIVAVAAMAAALRRSVPGRLIIAARDNDRALASFGVTPATVKLATLAVSGFMAASAGVLWGSAWRSVGSSLVSPAQSLVLLVIPVVGGLGSIGGAIAATAMVFGITYFVGPELTVFLGDFGRNLGFQLAAAGLGLVAIPLAYPGGLAGRAQKSWENYLKKRSALAADSAYATSDLGDGEFDVDDDDDFDNFENLDGLSHSDDLANVDDLADLDDVVTARTLAGLPFSANGSRSDLPLRVRNVSLSFGGIQALKDVSIDVEPGEIVGLIGSNGAGKSTLINVIGGTYTPDAGSVHLGETELVGFAPEIRSGYGIGRSFQDARLFPGLTITEALQVALANKYKVGMVSSMLAAPWARQANLDSQHEAHQLLNGIGLGLWSESLTSEISTGMRRLTDVTMQVAAAPKVLLLDEPAAGIAQREAEALGPLLRELRDQLGCSMLIVEHDMPLLMSLCDRVYAMETGTVIAEGVPEEVRDNPQVIASYLGTTPEAINRSSGGAA